jgi:hypothetical protein
MEAMQRLQHDREHLGNEVARVTHELGAGDTPRCTPRTRTWFLGCVALPATLELGGANAGADGWGPPPPLPQCVVLSHTWAPSDLTEKSDE